MLAETALLTALIERGDHWRRSPASVGGRVGHKEWSHFCVFGDGIELLLNWSLMDDTGSFRPRVEVPRVTWLVRSDAGGWDGELEEFDSEHVAVRGGRIDLRMGASELRFRDAAAAEDAVLGGGRVALHLLLRPLARPAITSSIALGSGSAVRWFVVPRLEADGVISVAGRRHELRRAPSYHDRDWGRFGWGGDFSWEWAIALPDDRESPWSLVFQRFSDRHRLRVLSQGILLWRRGTHARTLHSRDLSVRSSGRLRAAACLRVPRVMALAAPGSAADLPRRIEIEASNGGDRLAIELELLDLAQIVVPNDGDVPGVTVISEARSRANVEGRVRGERVSFAGPAVVELNRAPA